MNKLEEREERRKKSIVESMIQEQEVSTNETPMAGQSKKRTDRKSVTPESETKDRVQRAYWLDKDIEKALRKKSLEEEKNLTEAVNEALRQGLAKYL